MLKRLLYRGYSRVARNERWYGRRFSPAGRLVLVGLVATVALGVDTTLNVAYLAFVVLAAIMVVSMSTSMLFAPRLDAERLLPKFGSVGTLLRYDLRLTNRKPRSQRGLALFENLIDPRPTVREFLDNPEPGEERRNWWDRQVGWYRWTWLVSQKLVARPKEATLPICPARATVSVPLELVPFRRGVLRFEGLTIGAPDPFGLFRSLRTHPLPQTVLILPKRYPVPFIALPGTRKYQRGGVALASSIGESDEFVSLRDYRPGDPLRHIHWRSWARVGKPIVKEFQDEFFVRHALVVDTFGTPLQHAAFEEAVSVAASFACTLQTQETLLDLMFVGAEAFCFTMGRGLAHVEQMLEVLAGVGLCPDRPFSTLRDLVLRHADGISGCIFVFIKWDRERIELVRQLNALGVPVMTLVVAEPKEARLIEAALHGPEGVSAHLLVVGQVQEGLAKLGT
jgi:uncharacterized protein (DUF58 family)